MYKTRIKLKRLEKELFSLFGFKPQKGTQLKIIPPSEEVYQVKVISKENAITKGELLFTGLHVPIKDIKRFYMKKEIKLKLKL